MLASSPRKRLGRFLSGPLLAAALAILAVLSLWMLGQMEALRSDTARLDQDLAMTDAVRGRTAALFSRPRREARLLSVTITAYSPDQDQTDDTPWRGALGMKVRPDRTLAVSQDLVDLLGKRVFLPGIGFRVVEDLMHPRWNNRADLCVADRERAATFGVRKTEVLVLDED